MRQQYIKLISFLLAVVCMLLPLSALAEVILPMSNGGTLVITEMENDLADITDFNTPLGIENKAPFSMLLLISVVLMLGVYTFILLKEQKKITALRQIN